MSRAKKKGIILMPVRRLQEVTFKPDYMTG